MPRPFRSRTLGFHAVLGVALLAWCVLVANSIAEPLHVLDGGGPVNVALQTSAGQSAATNCDGKSMQPDMAPGVQAQPMGQGDCCLGGCHCHSVCGVLFTLAIARLTPHVQGDVLPQLATTAPGPVSTLPPLRPPIA